MGWIDNVYLEVKNWIIWIENLLEIKIELV